MGIFSSQKDRERKAKELAMPRYIKAALIELSEQLGFSVMCYDDGDIHVSSNDPLFGPFSSKQRIFAKKSIQPVTKTELHKIIEEKLDAICRHLGIHIELHPPVETPPMFICKPNVKQK